MTNIFALALMQLHREGRIPTGKNFGLLWERRVYKILAYELKANANTTRTK